MTRCRLNVLAGALALALPCISTTALAADPIGIHSLWWLACAHASKYGSYLSARTTFGRITGLDPRALGALALGGASRRQRTGG